MLIGYAITKNELLHGKIIPTKLTMEATLFILINSPHKHLGFLRKACIIFDISVSTVLIHI